MTEATKKKHVQKELNDFYHIPDDNQNIVQVIRGCGNNLHEVLTIDGEKFLVSMPTKFRRSVWIKRGDYLIVTPIEEGNKVRAEIHSILLKDHIRYLKEQNKWPKEFDLEPKQKSKTTNSDKMNESGNDDDDDDMEDDEDEEDFLEPNTNHPNVVEESESSSSDDDDYDDEDDAEDADDEQEKEEK